MKAFCGKVRIGVIAILGMVAFAMMAIADLSAPRSSVSAKQPAPSAAAKAAVPAAHNHPPRINFAQLPMRFERNDGQTDPQVKFLSRGQGYTLFITPGEAVLAMRQPVKEPRPGLFPRPDRQARANDKKKADAAKSAIVRIVLKGAASAPQIEGVDRLATGSNYFIGNDPKKWHTDVPNYAKVELKNVYPGIDLIYHGSEQGRLEYDFRLAPEADPDAIRLGFKGMKKLALDQRGDLVVSVGKSQIVEHAPDIYQEIGGNKQTVKGRWVLRGAHEAGFELASYDRTKPIVIDPVLLYSTYLGGSGGDQGNAIAVDSSGNAYVTGAAGPTDFPTLNAYQSTANGGAAFVAKLNPSASGAASLLYSTYLGGNGGDTGYGIAVDSSGNAYVTGTTGSFGNSSCTASGEPGVCCTGAGTGTCTAFPTLNAYQSTNNAATAANGGGGGVANAFVAKLNPSASGAASLLYSTYLGGSAGYSGDWGNGIAVDSSGDAYVTGATGSYGNSSCNGLDTPGACCTGAGTGTCIAFPTLNAFQSTLNGGENAFVAKLDPSASGAASLLYSTYLGGSTAEVGFGIAADPSGNAYVTGTTESNDFPTLNAYQSTLGGEYSNAFVAKLNPGLSGMASLLYSTYLGGDYYDMGYGIAVDSSANAYVTGSAASTNFPTLNAYQSTNNDTEYGNAFVAKLNPAASGAASLLYSSYLGGSGSDGGNGIAVDSSGNAYVTGTTGSFGNSSCTASGEPGDCCTGAGTGTCIAFPTLNAYQSTNNAAANGANGGANAFVAKLNPSASGAASLSYSTYLGGSGMKYQGDQGFGIALDSSGNAYVTGFTDSTNFPTLNAYQSTLESVDGGNAFVAELSPATPAPTPTGTATATATTTATLTAAPTATATSTVRATPTATATATTATRTATPTKTATPTATKTATPTATPTPNGSAVPATLAFGAEVAGQTSATIKTVTVTSKSKAALVISSVTVASTDGSATPEFIVTGGTCGPTYPFTVSPSPGSCTITVSFTPSAISSTDGRTGTLTIVDDAPTGTETIKMEGTGTTDVITAPASATIKNEHFGDTTTRYITIINKQSQQITLTPSITQTASGFGVASGGTCGGTLLARTVPAAGSCTIAYSYSPSALTPAGESGTLTISASPDLATSPPTVAITATTVPDTVLAVASAGLATNGGTPVTADTLKVTDLASPTFGIGALGVSIGAPYNGGSNNNSADFSVSSTPGSCPVGTAANVTCYPVTFTATEGTATSHVTESACIDVTVASDPGTYANACAGGTNAPGVHTVKLTGVGK
jgi:hypothetical protein